jgi:hypothetical protein
MIQKNNLIIKQEEQTMRQHYQYIPLHALTGNWESINLNPTVMILRGNETTYLLSILYVDECSGLAHPATYEIAEDEEGYYIYLSGKRTSITYDALSDTLYLSSLGEYLHN